jgi:hypothetical protein
MAEAHGRLPREVLQIPDRKHVGLTTFEATDPDTSYPPIERTHAFVFSIDETTDVGSDACGSVSEEYTPATSTFTGKVNWVQTDVDAAAQDLDHQVSPEERFQLAMAKQ